MRYNLSELDHETFIFMHTNTFLLFYQLKIFSYDKVIIPVHLGNHWCLAVINFRKKRFEYYDSLGGSGDRVLKVMGCIDDFVWSLQSSYAMMTL